MSRGGVAVRVGFWLHPIGPAIIIGGGDAGVSFRSSHDPQAQTTTTVLSNASAGAWLVIKALQDAQG